VWGFAGGKDLGSKREVGGNFLFCFGLSLAGRQGLGMSLSLEQHCVWCWLLGFLGLRGKLGQQKWWWALLDYDPLTLDPRYSGDVRGG